MGKRTLAMVLYDPAAADQQRDAKRARPSAHACAVVPYDTAQPAANVEPINAVPLNAFAPHPRPRRAPAPAIIQVPEEPACLREHILPALGLRNDLAVHFVDSKRVTDTDLDAHQNRFRLPADGVLRRLRPILTAEELDAANLLLHDPLPKPRRQQPEPVPLQLEKLAAGDEEQEKKVRKKRQGMVHGGLPVRMVDLAAGASGELLLSRWSSSSGTIVKGGGYMDFVRRCSFREHDVVDIWAFKQRELRLFGKTMVDESYLHLFIVKRDSTHHQSRQE
ncbi:unnamed protein product [Urochloa decumbens]|uniref:TF-B3 domain-containing protein n=1 Tax=Urochloa decumbens TaxID=240449 RepID=A0ABC8W0Y2_9POAL